jgi:glycosyltransferase involved in cell wall biosynthesis
MTGRRIVVVDGSARALALVRGPVLRAMRRRGHEVLAVAAFDRNMPELQIGNLHALYEEMDVPLVPLALDRQGTNPFADARALRQLTRVMRDFRPHKALAYSAKSSLYGSLAARLARVPESYSMITGLGFLFEDGGTARVRLARGVGRGVLARALRSNRRVIFQNPNDRDLFLERGIVPAADRTAVVAGSGVDLDAFPPLPQPARPGFLMIGRLQFAKGVREYAEAARLLRRTHPQARCSLLGPFDDHPSAVTRAQMDEWTADGALTYLGATADVRPYLADCDVFVLPSYREGLPRSALEAMSSARALVVTDVPGCREVVREGDNGFLVPVRNAEALAGAMARFLDDPGLAARFGERSRTFAEARFGSARVAEAVLAAMEL